MNANVNKLPQDITEEEFETWMKSKKMNKEAQARHRAKRAAIIDMAAKAIAEQTAEVDTPPPPFAAINNVAQSVIY